MKKSKPIDPDWKAALGELKTNFDHEKVVKAAYHREQENALRPYFKQAANHLNVSHQQLTDDIKHLEPKLKEVLTDRRLKACTYAKLIKKYNPAYYKLFEEKIKKAVLTEQKYFQEKKEAVLKAEATMQQVLTSKVIVRKQGKYEKRAARRQQRHKEQVKAMFGGQQARVAPQVISQWINVDWHEVIFDDYLIKIKYGTNFSLGYPVNESRKSFIFLKKYIKGLRLPALNVLLVGREIRAIENAESVREMVTLLRIKEQLIKDLELGKKIQADAMIEKIKAVSKRFLIQLAKAGDSEVQCIEYLASQLAEGFKPIPAFEIIAAGNSVSTEDTFLFVIERKAQLFLIWESTVHGRATYIFKTSIENYVDVVQSIYDYIGSPLKAKRMALRKSDNNVVDLGYDGYVTHSSFEHWQQKLESLFSR